VLENLLVQHILGAKMIRELEHALLRWEEEGKAAFPEFARLAKEYSDFHWKHMQEEEDFVLPLAERVLTEEDWNEVDAAFASNQDPLFNKDVEKDFDRLFTHIVNIAPPPIGLGPSE
jgi:hemerythrin-like domain-containing protein